MEAAQFLLVCPLACLAGFVDAVAGGGGLISLPAYLMAGLPAHVAIGTNKLSSAMGTALSVGKLARRGTSPGSGPWCWRWGPWRGRRQGPAWPSGWTMRPSAG